MPGVHFDEVQFDKAGFARFRSRPPLELARQSSDFLTVASAFLKKEGFTDGTHGVLISSLRYGIPADAGTQPFPAEPKLRSSSNIQSG
jgi:hypothetical protein